LRPSRLGGFAALFPLAWAVKGQEKEKPPSREEGLNVADPNLRVSAFSA
jgi:hypothetical protein